MPHWQGGIQFVTEWAQEAPGPYRREQCTSLVAADLAIKSFLMGLRGISVLLQFSSGIHKQPWRDCITSSYFSSKIPMAMGPGKGYCNNSPAHTWSTVADFELRLERDRSDWKVAHKVLQKINQVFGQLKVGLREIDQIGRWLTKCSRRSIKFLANWKWACLPLDSLIICLGS